MKPATERIIEICGAGGEPAMLGGLVASLEPQMRQRHAPAAHFQLLRDARLAARCSIWTDAKLVHHARPVGFVGHYAAADVAAGAALLTHAVHELRARGFPYIVGPMDGSTWRRYRLLTERGTEPPFFLEPDNPDDWPKHFQSAGFVPLAHYFSALNSDLSVLDPRVADATRRMNVAGVTLRQINADRFEEELMAIHALSLEAFAGNFLYTPISQAEFLEMYTPIRPHLRPELVLLAEKGPELVGFVFGLPDLLQARAGERVTTAIAKSMAVRPGRTGAGLGSILMNEFQQAARRLGFLRVIHALMHQDNRSMQISARFGRPIRQYTLYLSEPPA